MPVLTKDSFVAISSDSRMHGRGNNFGAEVGQSQQLVHGLRGVGGAAVAKPLSALTRQSKYSGALRRLR